MSEDVRIGGDETNEGGIEVPGKMHTPLDTLVDWTNEVVALQIASALFPDLEAVIDDNGYAGPSPDGLGPDPGFCWLLCRTQNYAEKVFQVLEDNAEELNLIPELHKNRALVVIRYHKFD